MSAILIALLLILIVAEILHFCISCTIAVNNKEMDRGVLSHWKERAKMEEKSREKELTAQEAFRKAFEDGQKRWADCPHCLSKMCPTHGK